MRNPYYYRVDQAGHQLPYIDQVIVDVADSKLIPAKTGAGETDLQARYLRFDNYTFLKVGEKHGTLRVRLWDDRARQQPGALSEPQRQRRRSGARLLRDVRFRRALSLGDRPARDQPGDLFRPGDEGANTVLPASPLYKQDYRSAWADFDPVRPTGCSTRSA